MHFTCLIIQLFLVFICYMIIYYLVNTTIATYLLPFGYLLASSFTSSEYPVFHFL